MDEDGQSPVGPESSETPLGSPPVVPGWPDPSDRGLDRGAELFHRNTSAFLRYEENIPTLPRFTPSIRAGMTKFLATQPDFDIRKTSIVTATTRPGALPGVDKELDQAVVDGLCDMQRTLALASNLAEFRALVSSDLTSAFKIASMTVNQLLSKTSAFSLVIENAKGIHARATNISNRNQRVLTSLHQTARGSGMAALDGPRSESQTLLHIHGGVTVNTVNNINLEVLFGAMDSDPCDDCNSVTSPAAYFVDILQFLRNNNLDPDNEFTKRGTPDLRGTVLGRLFARRPDLGNLKLTSPNTTAILPYLDLANETMESFLVHLEQHTFDAEGNVVQAQLDVYNCGGTPGELLSEPQHTDFRAYEILSSKIYPFHKLPYNQALDEVRTFLGHLGTSRYELLKTYHAGHSTPEGNSDEIDWGTRAMVAEYLHLTDEEYSALAGEPCRPEGQPMLDEIKYWGYKTEVDLQDSDKSACRGLRYIQAQFLPRSGIQFPDLVNLLESEYINPIADIEADNRIGIMQPGKQGKDYALVRPNDNVLSITDYKRLRQLIHLWQRIGWTIDETDKAICGLSKPDKRAEITPDVLEQLVAILKLLEITELERPKLITFWSPISMRGPDSLYYRLFLTSGATRADRVLELDENGEFQTSANISQHEPVVMATLGLTKEGLDALKAQLSNDELSISNLTILYRHSLMAKFLGVTPAVLLVTMETFGNPFLAPISCLEFVALWNRMKDIGFTFAQLNYVVNGVDDPANPLGLSEKKIREIMHSLRNGFAAYATLNAAEDDQGRPITVLSPGKQDFKHDQIKEHLGIDLIVMTISKALDLDQKITRVVLSHVITVESTTLLSTILFEQERLLQRSKTHPTELPEEAQYPEGIKSLFSLLSRTSIFISGLKLSAAEIMCVITNQAGFEGFTEAVLSLNGWKRLLAYSELRESLPKGVDATLLDLFQWKPIHDTEAVEGAKKIANLMRIKEETVQTLMNHLGLPGKTSFQDVTVLTNLKKANDYAKMVGVDVPSLISWASTAADFRNTHQVAQAIRGSIRARFSEGDWEKIVKPLQNQLRQNQREALIACLLVQPALIKWGVIDADSLFEFFLIDVQMGPCVETSRIKQAISTVQVFVQRCFCGLEKRYGILNDTLDEKRWEWMKNYRMWEANRKVFLYPENWLEPSLRDNKSQIFLEFEADLIKKDLNSESMQHAVKNYISRVDEVTNLLPVSFVTENRGGAEIVHLFARTRSTPCEYYYRPWNRGAGEWKPWEKMTVDIQYHDDDYAVGHGGVFLYPAVIEHRLIVFTPQIVKLVREGRKAQFKNDNGQERVAYFEIKLGWSEYRNGEWTPKRLSSEAVRWKSQEMMTADMPLPNAMIPMRWSDDATSNFSVRRFRFGVNDHKIDVYLPGRGVSTPIGTFDFNGATCITIANERWYDHYQPKVERFPTEAEGLAALSAFARFGVDTGYEFDMKTKAGDRTLTLCSGDWIFHDNPPTLEHAREGHIKILLTRPSTGLLTHTSVFATLDQIYTQLHKVVDPTLLNELSSPFSLYDWELGVHAPMLLMNTLASSHQYDKAIEIARFVFNPFTPSADDPKPGRVWRWAPFREISKQESFKHNLDFLRDLPSNQSNKQVNDWRNTPFQPHAVARGRPVAYMKWMVMRYIAILIAAGDQLFRQETMESMPLALQYYTLAAHLHGEPNPQIPNHRKRTTQTFNTLVERWDAFSNAMVTFENTFPFTNSTDDDAGGMDLQLGHFCVPINPAIRDLRAQIDDRLYKIRHSQDINGITRKLALFEPPIDVGTLVRTAAAGLSLSSVLNSISGPMPNYRFQYLLRGALEMVQELKSLAGAFLIAKEKRDSEAYQRIRAGHESTINALVLGMKKLSRDEANTAIDSLRGSRDGPLCRLNHFLQLIGEDMVSTSSKEYTPVHYTIERPTGDHMTTRSEKLESTLSHVAAGLRALGATLAVISASTLVIPSPETHAEPMGVGVSVKAGPVNVAEAFRAGSLAAEGSAGLTQHFSDAAARTNSLVRQYQDRVLQANSAGHELNSINAQIKTQEVRVKIVEKDIELQEKQIETAKATEEFLRSKYTNEALYSWQETQLRTLHYQTYILAYDLAKKVEKSYHFERGLAGTATNLIVGGWDDSRDGLFSGEALGLGLRRLEAAYQESRGHDFEITKHISLRQIAPKALLDLRTTTSCKFSLSEALFDMDFPGHHTRRLKSVSLSLPCVVGPYTSVNCTLRLTSNSYRLGNSAKTTVMEQNYVPIQSVAFSSAQNDPGVFELNFHDERYLPFEGAGVISTWDLSLPKFRGFDYNTISDVVMHLRYTSIVGADTEAATKRVNGYLSSGTTSDSRTGDVLYASFDLRNEFSSAWQQLASSRSMPLSNLEGRLPWWTTRYDIEVMKIELLPLTNVGFEIEIENEGEKTKQVSKDGGMSFSSETPIKQFGTWRLAITNPTTPTEKPKFPPTGLWMVVQYKAVVKTT